MKRAAILILLALAGCDLPPPAEVPKQPPTIEFASGSTYWLGITADPDTGCQYLIYDRRTLTPRISADGHTHMGCKGVEK